MKTLLVPFLVLAVALASLPGCAAPQASTSTAAAPVSTATPAGFQKVLDEINQFNDGAISDINSPAGQQLLTTLGVGLVNALNDYSSGNKLGAGIAGGTALAGALGDAAQLPTTTAQLAQVNAAGAKLTGQAAAVAPFVAKIIALAKQKTSAGVKANAIIQKASQAVKTVAQVPGAVQQVTAIGQ